MLKWNKEKEKCRIYLELPEYDILIYDIKDFKKKDIIDRPPTRRPLSSNKMSIYDHQGSFYRNHKFQSTKQELMRPLTPSTQFFAKKIKNIECGTIIK